jgi:hypothetical protein
MSSSDLRPAALDAAALARIQALEDALDTPLVAYSPESPWASLTDAQLAEVQAAEADRGVRLLAYR